MTPVRSNLLPDKTTCGISTEARIYGGEATELDEFPWMALLEYQLRKYQCLLIQLMR